MITWNIIFLSGELPTGLEGCQLENAVEELRDGSIDTTEYRLVDRNGNVIAEWPYNPSLTDLMEIAKGRNKC